MNEVTEQTTILLSFNEWYEYGVANGFCSGSFCFTHDGAPMSETEELLWEDGSDPCSHGVRFGTPTDWETDAVAYKEFVGE
jgi:hypothetical protein